MAPSSVFSRRLRVRNRIICIHSVLSLHHPPTTLRFSAPSPTKVTNSNTRSAGVSSYEISLEKKEVIVKGTVPYDTVYEKIDKAKKVRTTNLSHIPTETELIDYSPPHRSQLDPKSIKRRGGKSALLDVLASLTTPVLASVAGTAPVHIVFSTPEKIRPSIVYETHG